MKKSYSLVYLCILAPLFLLAQSEQSKLFHQDEVSFRNGPTNINPEWGPFFHGVASGDPLEDRVIIWTRVTPEELDAEPIEVNWEVATDPMLENVVQSGTFTTNASRDYTVKVDVSGLQSGTTYYYGFTALEKPSLTGRTKTTPTAEESSHLKFGVVSCSNFQSGYFNAYRRLANYNDLDAIVHLGDYIYEYPDGTFADSSILTNRPIEPLTEILSLTDYRTRYSTYRLDTALSRLHQQHAIISVWDDHESANNSYQDGAQNHTEGVEGSWVDRKAIAKQAYFEWMPIRENNDQQVYRTIQYGNLADLILLDTRLEGRQQQLTNAQDSLQLFDTTRTILGEQQREWLFEQLSSSNAKWKVIGQQVFFSELNIGWGGLATEDFTFWELESLFLDAWDGYPAERSKVINYIAENQIDNVVILTGDIHVAIANDVVDYPVDVEVNFLDGFGELPEYLENENYNQESGEGSVAVEFVTPSISSSNFDETFGLELALVAEDQINTDIEPIPGVINLGNPNPHIKFSNLVDHGYFLLDLKPDTAQANWYFTPITNITQEQTFESAWLTLDGANRLQAAINPSAPKAIQDQPAPLDPPFTTSTSSITDEPLFALLGTYPNPVKTQNTLHFSLAETAPITIQVLNLEGKVIDVLVDNKLPKGTYAMEWFTNNIANGTYFYQIQVRDTIKTVKIIVVE